MDREKEIVAHILYEIHARLQDPYDELEMLEVIDEFHITRSAMKHLLDLKHTISSTELINEVHTSLEPARFHLYNVIHYPQAEFARVCIQHLLNFVTEYK